jgi:hypothetical protein
MIESQFREIRDQYADAEEAEVTYSNLDSDITNLSKPNQTEQTLTAEQEQALLDVLPPDQVSYYSEEPVEAASQ